MAQRLTMTKPFTGWKRPSQLMRILARLFCSTKLIAEDLPDHGRATNPALTNAQIEYLTDSLADWAHDEAHARLDYLDQVKDSPDQGDVHFAAYRQACERAGQAFRLRLQSTLNPPRAVGEQPRRLMVPTSEIDNALTLATNYKNWLVRRSFPSQYGDSHVAYERARWFFTDYLVMWERPRVQE